MILLVMCGQLDPFIAVAALVLLPPAFQETSLRGMFTEIGIISGPNTIGF